ncbi:hypothetical protein [Streptomyces sp. NRRL WC-3742]|uniref:hypothetical protein n=1 Tax=Streptomyces sp. NRRL WC-3742 TaxID=1463934 RepID=UPI000A6EE3AD|nr:hypothetical protein [Streptomyces sp. NRRL WC-3742]
MLLLGLLLLAASGAFTGLLIADNLSGGPDYQVTVLGNDLVTLNGLGIFLAGIALALLFCLGLAMSGLARRTSTGRLGRHRGARLRRADRLERLAPPTDPAVPPIEAVTPRAEPLGPRVDAVLPTPEQRAAEQDGREGEVRRTPRWRRGGHLFGH